MSRKNPNAFNDAALGPGQMLGRYELLLPIAAGGMGSVWAARLKGTRGFRKLVAVKTILCASEDARLEQMLFQEASVASQIHHPNVVETLELGEDRGILFLVMELIHGESLSYILREALPQGGVPQLIAVNLIGQVCKGLQAAHDLCDDDGCPVGLVHRDVSPPNVLVTYAGTVKVVDFGVATTSSTATLGSGEIKGKISYLAPEQLRGETLDARVDVFTTGILLYLLTAGRHPFKAATEAQTINRILDDRPADPPSSISSAYPRELERVVLRALEKDRDARYQSAAEFLEALERAVPGAFGANSETVVADYVHDLLRNRLAERRAMLRIAEELAEKSSSRDSAPSVSGMATPVPAGARRSRRWPFVAGLSLATAVAASVFAIEKTPWRDGESGSSALPLAPRDAALAAGVHALLPEGPPTADGARPSLERPAKAATVAATVATVPAPARKTAKPARDADTDSGFVEPLAAAPAAAPGADASFLTDPVAEPSARIDPIPVVPLVLPPIPSAPQAPAEAPREQPREQPRDAGPKQLSSKLGHARLAVDPGSPAYRVKLPPALERGGQSFAATVRICVSAEGHVARVNVLQSAGPAVDKQIPSVLGRWRYRPLLDGNRAVPFCYVLKYEVTGRR